MQYSDEKIREALNPWEIDKNNEPLKNSLISRLSLNFTDKIKTTLIIERKYAIVTGVAHYFLTVNGINWHPKAPEIEFLHLQKHINILIFLFQF